MKYGPNNTKIVKLMNLKDRTPNNKVGSDEEEAQEQPEATDQFNNKELDKVVVF